MKKATQVKDDQICHIPAYQAVNAELLFMPGTGRREGFSCGDWSELGGPRDVLKDGMKEDDWKLLTHGFVWHPDAFNIASKAVHYLGIFNYGALHARYNDFQ